MKKNFLLILLCAIASSLYSQAKFTNRNDLLAEKDMHSAVPVGIADMNGDGLDDLVVLNEGTELFIQYQTPDPARPFVRYRVPVSIANGEQNDICIADFNNDGTNDIMAVGSYDRVKVIYSIPNTYEYNHTNFVVTPFFSQAATSGDFNHDGWVDVVMLNDNGLNYTLLNDGAGNLAVADLFDFVTVPPSDNSGNYGSVYTDFDMDGDVDFYIAKCRQGVSSQTDPRRINAMFVNDGSGNYTQDAARYGLASGRQSWTADFGDFDNDGDLDCFITQHDVISELYENIDNDTFINITPQSGLNILGVPLQGLFRDFDNDGFLDILVSGDRLDYYHNNGDKTFTKINPFGDVVFGTFALGDLNLDGFTDVYASRVIPYNNPDLFREDILFLNDGNDNHFLGLTLRDTAGNPSAIGAMAILYGPWGTQIREVRGGEQYGVSSGHSIIFGLGDETAYDSLVIRWADGTREHYNELNVNKTWSIRRGGCYSLPQELLPPLTILCDADTLLLSLDTELEIVSWSNGLTDDTIVINEPGIIYAWLSDANGCPVRTSAMEVIQDPDTIKPVIYYEGNTQLCSGEAVLLSLPSGSSYLWSSGETTQTIEASISGEYYASVGGYCKAQASDTIVLDFLFTALPVTTQDTFMPGESAILTATGDDIFWFSDPFGTNLIGSGNSLQLDDLTDTTTVYAQNVLTIEGLDYHVGPVSHQGNTKYNSNFVNGGLLFEVYEPIILHQLSISTDSVGVRIVEIFNDEATFFFAHEVSLPAGTSVVDLNVELPAGSYTISTNTDSNLNEFGINSPLLWRSPMGVSYPYVVNDVISIVNSTFGEDFYYYFYDWKISTQDKNCTSELVPATAVLDLGTAASNIKQEQLAIVLAPNPTDGFCQLSVKTEGSFDIEITNLEGALLFTQSDVRLINNDYRLDFSTYASGIYLVKIIQKGKSATQKVVRL